MHDPKVFEIVANAIYAVQDTRNSATPEECATAALDALAAAGRLVPGWQPIETAPRDGEEVLVYFGPSVGVCSARWVSPDGCDEWKSWCVDDGKFDPHPVRGYREPYPTHWMPLPAAPRAEDQP